MKKLLAAAVAAAMTMTATFAMADGAIKIGEIGPLTGAAAIYGTAVANGAQIAIDELNALGGQQYELNAQDDEADAEKSVNAYNNLLDWGAQMMLATVTTNPCIAVGAQAHEDRVFMLTPSASSSDVTADKDNVYQVCFTDPAQGTASAQYIAEHKLAEKVAVIYNNADAYSTGIYQTFDAEAKKLGLKGISRDQLPKWKLLARDCYLIIPLILLVWLVSSGSKTMSHSAAYSILAAIVVGFVNFFLQGKRGDEEHEAQSAGKALASAGKRSFFSAVESLEAGSRGAITVAVACAMAGIIAGCITVTGLASILINAIVQLAGNATIIGLVLTMLCCIVLGMGVPTTANYCIMASTCAPILIQLGFPVVAAHFFVFYFGIVADITPPVALAAYAGSAIAKSNPMKTGLNATKLAIAAFIVPYIFAYSPALLFENISGWWEVVQICVSALLGIFGIAAALNGHLFKKVGWPLRILLVVGGLGMMIPGTVTDLAGLLLVGAIVAYQYLSNKRASASAAA